MIFSQIYFSFDFLELQFSLILLINWTNSVN